MPFDMDILMPHKLGQVFLKDQNTIDKCLNIANLQPEDHVVEIGCGEGWLSQRLADEAGKLTIVELDPKWVEVTQDRLKHHDHVQLIHQDILKVRLQDITQTPVRIVANVPYYISAKIVQWIISQRPLVKDALLLFQKEFAEKCVVHVREVYLNYRTEF